MAEQERFYAIGTRVQRRTYRIRDDYQSWMGAHVSPKDAPFSVLESMAEHATCSTEGAAQGLADRLNAAAKREGNLQIGTIVVP
jgi:hypothetical protein